MPDLIPFATRHLGNESVNTVNARDLYAYLELTGDYSLWISRAIKRHHFVENVDYVQRKIRIYDARGGRPRIEHFFTQEAHNRIASYYQFISKKMEYRYIYAAREGETQHIKIGITNDFTKRLGALQNGNPSPITYLGVWDVGSDAKYIEKRLHRLFVTSHLINEWFHLSKCQEEILVDTMKSYPRIIVPSHLVQYHAQIPLYFSASIHE